MKRIFQYLAFVAFVTTFAAPSIFAQDSAEAPKKSEPAKDKKAAKKERVRPIEVLLEGNEKWRVNYPRALYDLKRRRFVLQNPTYANIRESRSGVYTLYKPEQQGVEITRKLSAIKKIRWPDNDPLLIEAQAEIARGNASGALGIAERFLKFFTPLKSIEGSPWIRAAVIKLDALDLQKNDAVLDSFIREIEATPNYSSIEGLEMKIKLARLFQLVRKGQYSAVLTNCDAMMIGLTDIETLARLHIVKGDALYNLSRYEEALKTYLRIPVFYGNQAAFMPKAKLAVARCLLRMDKPGMESMNLAKRSEEYLLEVINEYPMAPETKAAIELLPKHKRDEIAASGTLEQKAAERGEITAKIDAENAELRKSEEPEEADPAEDAPEGDPESSDDAESDPE